MLTESMGGAPMSSMAAIVSQSRGESVGDKAKRWAAHLKAGGIGPNVIAREVCQMADDWERYRADVEGKDCDQWLRYTFGPGHGLAWFQTRNAAMERLGRSARTQIEHGVAVWVVGCVSPEKIDDVRDELLSVYALQRHTLVTLSQAKRIAAKITGKVSAPRTCAVCERCVELTALLTANGIEVPETE